MEAASPTSPEVNLATVQPILPLDRVTTPTVTTAAAAHYLNRRPQTLRSWAAFENGPLRPVRVHGRLAWNVAAIRKALGVA